MRTGGNFRRCLMGAMVVLLGVGVAAASIPDGYIDASTYGTGWNATDATAALQGAINTGGNVYVPKMASDWIVTPITLKSNQTILFESGVVVSAKAGAFTSSLDSLFTGNNISNVTLSGYGATLRMNQEEYTSGEWRMGIRTYTARNFTVEGLTIRDTGGDGIYIGANSGTYAENVLIKDVRLDNNYRNGITIISGQGVVVDNAIITNTRGTWPKSGIDLEPNYANQRLNDITIKNSIFDGNGGSGILFNLGGGMTDIAQTATVTVENITSYHHVQHGLTLKLPMPGVTIKNSLFVSNKKWGIYGPEYEYVTQNSIDYSAFWDNAQTPKYGRVTLGPTSLTNVEPIFYSVDPNNPYYMYLDAATSALITAGSDLGSYMGARPVYVPEPAGLALILICGGLLVHRPAVQRRETGGPYRTIE